MILKNIKNKNLFFTTDPYLKLLNNSEIAFIAVGTPMGDDGYCRFTICIRCSEIYWSVDAKKD